MPGPNRNAERTAVIASVLRHRTLLHLVPSRLVAIAGTGVGAGLVQAVLLLLIVRAASAVTAGETTTAVALGPFGSRDLTVNAIIVAGFITLLVLFAFEALNSVLQARLTARSISATQRAMLSAYTASDYSRQTENSRGETSQLVFGMPGSAGGLASALASALTGATNFVTLVLSAIVISPIATGGALVGFLMLLVTLRPIMMLTQRLATARTREQRALSGHQLERLELAAEVKAFGVSEHLDAHIDAGIGRLEGLTTRIRLLARASSVVYRLGVFAMILAMLAVISRSANPDLSTLTASMLLLLRSLSFGQSAQQGYQTMAEIVPVIDQLDEAHDAFRAATETHGTAPVSWHAGSTLRADSLAFAYGDDEVLSNVSFDIESGAFVAVIGPSGAGKSTLLQLLLRLRQPTAGQITVGPTALSEIANDSWHDLIGYVPQSPRLLSGTVREAVRFGRPIDDDALRVAAERAHIAADIESWPNGWDTELQHVGETLSGGQRQRLALARALAGAPRLLFLDEPTSALDPESERSVATTLESLKGSVTIVVIAHRLGTVRCADKVIVVDGTVRTTTFDELDSGDISETIAA